VFPLVLAPPAVLGTPQRRGASVEALPQCQQLLRLVLEDVRVKGWQIALRLRLPLDYDLPAPRTGPPQLPPAEPDEDGIHEAPDVGGPVKQ